MVQSLPGFLDLSLNVCSLRQVLRDVYTEVLEATHPLHRNQESSFLCETIQSTCAWLLVLYDSSDTIWQLSFTSLADRMHLGYFNYMRNLHVHIEWFIIYIYAFSRRFYPKRITIAVRLYIFISMCVPWESNPQPFALLTQCSTTEPHRNPDLSDWNQVIHPYGTV